MDEQESGPGTPAADFVPGDRRRSRTEWQRQQYRVAEDDERADLTDSDREAVACRFHFDLPWNPRIQFLSHHPVLFFRAPTCTIGYMSYLKR